MRQILDNVKGQLIANLADWGIVYVIVQGAATVRLGDDPRQLANDPTDGIPLTVATPAQQSFLWWKGQLFGISSAASTIVSVQQPGKKPTGS